VRVLIDLASESTFDGITESLVAATNFFDSPTTTTSLSAFYKILKKVRRTNIALSGLTAKLVEAFWLFQDDLTLLSSIFDFFTVYR
jgi:hypothetical protein